MLEAMNPVRKPLCHAAAAAILFLAGHPSLSGQESKVPLLVVKDNLYGYVDHSGKTVIPPQFLWADYFKDGYAKVFVCGRYLSIDNAGGIGPYHLPGGVPRPVRDGKKVGFMNSKRKWEIPARFDDALLFSDGLAAVQLHQKWGFIDRAGVMVIPPRFDLAYYFYDGVGFVTDTGKSFMIDRAGKVLAEGAMLTQVSEGLVPLRKGDFDGVVDMKGRIVIPFIYDFVGGFSEGVAAVKKNGKYGYIDHAGQVVIPLEYDYLGSFRGGLAPAKAGSEKGYVDHSGQFLFKLDMDQLGDLIYGDVGSVSNKDGMVGYVNRAGTVIWGPTAEWPSLPPLFGWTKDDEKRSCEGIPPAIQKKIAGFPRW